MKNVSAIKSKAETPKTPGGISKSLLTPCRRVGLSRNWKRSGPFPFNSPLSSTEVKQDVEKVEKKTRKRKDVREESDNSQNDEIQVTPDPPSDNADNVCTPIRNVELPRRKKSKILLSTLNNTNENEDPVINKVEDIFSTDNLSNQDTNNTKTIDETNVVEPVSTPVRLKFKSKSKRKSPVAKKDANKDKIDSKCEEKVERWKVKSPNDLTKECIVVLQKKMFKEEIKDSTGKEKVKKPNKTSQTLFDSDSDDVPLCQINNDIKHNIYEDEDFTIKTLKIPEKSKKEPQIAKPKKTNSKTQPVEIKTQNSQNSDDDDDCFEKKRTIIVKRTYEKAKLVKAKSTGSITQKEIDELKLRIEKKKKMLLAKAITEDTEELRGLIKKWQKGCQDALMELMDLMKNKMPEKNMDYSEMLKALKIPANLVGYDSENDNFCTPNDGDIILANLGD